MVQWLALENDTMHNLLIMKLCIEKQSVWLGTSIISGNLCFYDLSDSVKDIEESRPLQTASSKKTIAHKTAD